MKANSQNAIREEIEAALSELRLAEWPTRFELAQTTAALCSAGLISRHADHKDSLKEALALWKDCGAVLEASVRNQEKFLEARRGRLNYLKGLPVPNHRFPISIEPALRCILKKKSEAECMPVFRRYLGDSLGKLPSNKDVATCIAGYRKKPLGQMEYLNLAEALERWSGRHRSERARKAAKAKAAKANEKR